MVRKGRDLWLGTAAAILSGVEGQDEDEAPPTVGGRCWAGCRFAAGVETGPSLFMLELAGSAPRPRWKDHASSS